MSERDRSKDVSGVEAESIHLPVRKLKTEGKSLIQENRLLKKQNELLRKQLEHFSMQLDLEIRKKAEEYQHKPWASHEEMASKELRNAYKKCDIYKKQASFYKKKMDLLSDQNNNQENQYRLKQFEKENSRLNDEVVHLKKIIKLQEKGLEEFGVKGYLSAVSERDKMQEQVKRLKKQLNQSKRKNNLQASEMRMSNSKVNDAEGSKVENKKRMNSVHSEAVGYNSSDSVVEKTEKEGLKLKYVTAERDKLREQISLLQQELQQKSKTIEQLKERIENLRRNNQQLQSQLALSKREGEEKYPSVARQTQSRSNANSKQRIWAKQSLPKGAQTQKLQGNEISNSQKKMVKWSHQAFASKIKEIHVLVHEKGHVKDIHAKYEKGQPKFYHSKSKSCYQSLACRQGEFIKHISGCFSDGYLQCLTVTTSDKRSQTFGNKAILEQIECQKFEFALDNQQVLGALYGQNDEGGVRRLGGMILKK